MAKITDNFRQSALRRGFVVRSNKADSTVAANLVYASVLEMANAGFVVNPLDLDQMSASALVSMVKDARAVMGTDRDWTPIYPGFPKQVEDLDTMTLLVEQIMHYWTGGAFLPNHPTVAREGLPLEDMLRTAREVKVVTAAHAARELTRQLVTAPHAMSFEDRELLKGCMELQHPDLDLIREIGGASRNGENMQAFLTLCASVTQYSAAELLTTIAPVCDNVDQLLRSVLALASKPAAAKWEDNYDLAVNTLADRHARAVRMDRLPRSARRVIVGRLADLSVGFKADNLVKRQDLWRGVMRAAHPYDLNLTEAQRRAVDIVHSNGEYRTLNSFVEEAMEKGKVKRAVKLLSENNPGELLRRVVALLRLVKKDKAALVLAEEVREVGARSTLTTLISSYNGIIAANDDHARVTRVAGLNNTMLERELVRVDEDHIAVVADAVKDAMVAVLKAKPAPTGPVAVLSDQAVPLVRRDAATADRVLDRGQEIGVAGDGDVLRLFGHWNNNQNGGGYMDIGVVVLDEHCNQLAVSTWNSWSSARDWSTYSGDKYVTPGDSAAEYIDVKLAALRKKFPHARYATMTVQSWSGWPMDDVDFIAGAMLRSSADKGKTFDARAVTTAFHPTTKSTQAVPFVIDLQSNKMVWLDSSNGSTESGVSSTHDESIGAIVYDELVRPRLTLGELASLYAQAHGAEVTAERADRDQLMALLG